MEALEGEVIDRAEKFGMYGITSHPLPGADALVLAVGGVRQHPIILVDDRRHRVRELAEGEVCVYTDEDNPDGTRELHRVILKDGRICELHAGASSIVMSPTGITLTAANGSTIEMTNTDIDLEAGSGSTIGMDASLDLDGTRIDLN